MKNYDPIELEADLAFVRGKLQTVDKDIKLPESLSAARMMAKMAEEEVALPDTAPVEKSRSSRVIWLQRFTGIVAAAAVVAVGVIAFNRMGPAGPLAEESNSMVVTPGPAVFTVNEDPVQFVADYGEIGSLLYDMVVVQDPAAGDASESQPESSPAESSSESEGAGLLPASQPGIPPEMPEPPTELVTPDLTAYNDEFLFTYKGGAKASVTVVGLPGLTIESQLPVDLRAGSKFYLSGNNLILIQEEQSGRTTLSTVAFIDISDPRAPKMGRIFRQDGRFMGSRLVDDMLYVVSFHQVAPTEENVQNMQSTPGEVIPTISDSLTGKSGPLAPENIAIVPNPVSPTYAVVSRFEANSNGAVQTVAALGGAEHAYVSEN